MPCIVCRAPGSPLNPQPILLTEASLQDEPVPIITLTMCLLLLWARAAVVDSSSGDKSSTNAPSEMKGTYPWLVLWPTPWFCSTLSAQNLSMLNDPLFAKPTTYLCIWLLWCLFGWGGRVIWVHLRAIIMLKGLYWDGDVISHSLVGCLFDDKKINPEISHCMRNIWGI